jgi:hypothetical protein
VSQLTAEDFQREEMRLTNCFQPRALQALLAMTPAGRVTGNEVKPKKQVRLEEPLPVNGATRIRCVSRTALRGGRSSLTLTCGRLVSPVCAIGYRSFDGGDAA